MIAGRPPYVVWFSDPRSADAANVGGKNASLGEMTQTLHAAGIVVPEGFATTVGAYWDFVEANGLQQAVAAALAEYKAGCLSLTEVGRTIREQSLRGEFP